jgi:hypothetical protein
MLAARDAAVHDVLTAMVAALAPWGVEPPRPDQDLQDTIRTLRRFLEARGLQDVIQSRG